VTGERVPAGEVHNLSPAGAPLLVRYDLDRIGASWSKAEVAAGPATMWRYGKVLPVQDAGHVVTMGEGWTPLLEARRLGADLGLGRLWIKDEGLNPTGSFKARGLSCAISMCRELGIRKVAAPSAGNAAGATAAYCALAGIEAHLFLPKDVPEANYLECKALGARVTLVDGLIHDCGRMVAEGRPSEGWFELSTLKEPYRIEGKKTMGYELAEQLGWRLPDAILYPAGGGVGLIGMWKAFQELRQMGWIGEKMPRMIAVQTTGCQPVVKAFDEGRETAELWPDAHTVAAGLRVPKPLGDRLMLRAIRESGGVAVAVDDEVMMDASVELARGEGVFAAPEGGACVAAARLLRERGVLSGSDEVVIWNTGSGYKYLEAYAARFDRRAETVRAKL
jgi:threonine synthase